MEPLASSPITADPGREWQNAAENVAKKGEQNLVERENITL